MPFSLERFREERLRKTRVGAIGFWASVVFAVFDATTPLPTVERGAFIFASVTLMAIFGGLYCLGRRLPLEETIEIARLHNNQLKVTDLTRELNVSITTAQRILSKLAQKGLAVSTTSPDEYGVTVYIFPELKVDKPVPVTPGEWEAYRLDQKEEEAAKAREDANRNRTPPRSEGLMDKQ